MIWNLRRSRTREQILSGWRGELAQFAMCQGRERDWMSAHGRPPEYLYLRPYDKAECELIDHLLTRVQRERPGLEKAASESEEGRALVKAVLAEFDRLESIVGRDSFPVSAHQCEEADAVMGRLYRALRSGLAGGRG